MNTTSRKWALALHGGAGSIDASKIDADEAHMGALLQRGAEMLEAGVGAVDVVAAMVEELEACGRHVAGRGAAPNAAGQVELDAAIMDGRGRAGAVAALANFPSAVKIARAVMEKTPHVMLAGDGAARFALEAGFSPVAKPGSYFRPASSGVPAPLRNVGTVGAVALDRAGRLAAATSTGGLHGKMPGRVGDSPIIGAGCWADEAVAVSCTGVGEFFVRKAAAHEVSARVRLAWRRLEPAARGVIAEIEAAGGQGGMIAVDGRGAIAMPFTGEGMKRAAADSEGLFDVRTRP